MRDVGRRVILKEERGWRKRHQSLIEKGGDVWLGIGVDWRSEAMDREKNPNKVVQLPLV